MEAAMKNELRTTGQNSLHAAVSSECEDVTNFPDMWAGRSAKCSESYSRGHSIVSQHFMEPKSSLPNSQELPTYPYPDRDQSSSRHPKPVSPRSI
jgi:hypothetical protein